MKMIRSGALVAGVLFAGVALGAGRLEPYEDSAPLDGAKEAEVQINLGLAKLELRAGDSKTLIEIHGEYDPEESDPQLRIDRRGDRAVINFDNREHRRNRHRNRDSDFESEDKFWITLSPKPLIDLDINVGLGKCVIDLDKLRIENLELDSGLSETDVSLDSPNPEGARRVTLKSGLGELKTNQLGYLRFQRLRVEGGLGDVELDLRGFEGDGIVDLNVGLGSCRLTVPMDVDVRIYYESNFLSSIDLDGFDKVAKNEYESEGFGKSKSTLEIDASVGMGNLTITRRR